MHRSIRRWTCYYSRGGSLSRHISSSSPASLLLNRPSAQPQSSHDAIRDLARWQRQHASDWQTVCSPILLYYTRQCASSPGSIEAFSIRHFVSQRKSEVIQAIDYNSIDDLLRDSCNALNSGSPLPMGPVWARFSRLLSDRQPRQVVINPSSSSK
jgi:hypothetical protein